MSKLNSPIKQGVSWLVIEPRFAGQRIDNYLMRCYPTLPRSYVYRILRRGEVRVNSKRIKPTYRVQTADKVRMPPLHLPPNAGDPEAISAAQRRQLRAAMLFEDEAVIVLNKPAGLAVHGGSGVQSSVIQQIRALGNEYKEAELVHRLDRATSGCLLLVKDRRYLAPLHAAWQSDAVEKRYVAWVKGQWDPKQTTLTQSLQKVRHRDGNWAVVASDAGKSATTHVRVRNSHQDYTVIELTLITGRTHQLRVQCAEAAHPIVGDDKYGDFAFNRAMRNQGIKRLMLHAETLHFPHPITQALVQVQMPLAFGTLSN